ncbi:hypothetical protein V8C42DRAFT_81017 [Trichoderma barbatum]
MPCTTYSGTPRYSSLGSAGSSLNGVCICGLTIRRSTALTKSAQPGKERKLRNRPSSLSTVPVNEIGTTATECKGKFRSFGSYHALPGTSSMTLDFSLVLMAASFLLHPSREPCGRGTPYSLFKSFEYKYLRSTGQIPLYLRVYRWSYSYVKMWKGYLVLSNAQPPTTSRYALSAFAPNKNMSRWLLLVVPVDISLLAYRHRNA